MDTGKLYNDPSQFFALAGSSKMRLSRAAAQIVARMCAERGLVVMVAEAGIFRAPKFEARTDGVWLPKLSSQFSSDDARHSNELAAQSIEAENAEYNAFILTVAPIADFTSKATIF